MKSIPMRECSFVLHEFSDYMLIKREESDIIKSECVRIPLNILDRI